VQFGLGALNAGAIITTQFLDLNEGIGGYDNDANYVPQRSRGDKGAIKRMYQGGMSLGGGGGLAVIPVLDGGNYNDISGYHYAWFHFAVRERMLEANGYADNHISFRGPSQGEANWSAMLRWVEAIKADTSGDSPRMKMARNKPADVVDGCWGPLVDGVRQFIPEPATFSREPDSQCNTLYPSYSSPRYVAGGPLSASIIKCRLKDIDLRDYAVSFTEDEIARLRRIFPDGVCDWSKRGMHQTGVVPWASFGPSPDNLVFDVTRGRKGHDDGDD
jgi:hypothetical protein